MYPLKKHIFEKSLATIAALGFIIAVATAIIYFMALPIFDAIGLAWLFVYGLIAFCIAVFALLAKAFWTGDH